ncbi:aminotransferase class I/II-fold pyridoxal phosphate-dependent enzyme [Duganella vulcania]|uniref:Aminotransferase class I/II-fold pyridoxal phosphate-dependent enzyme n=1 Tax=Duganella vulcania TaxID=2692166 RepID=A0A845GX84_9BURK|nr:pyridoxal phosphate-dependent aminotransferase family protein [Duganella vulcania]MYM97888.1 aminotransferase class I/II-fold pyridoxal phosphate-dependent enzyme [Duganella vulcania]
MHDLHDIADWLKQHPVHPDRQLPGTLPDPVFIAGGEPVVSFSSNNYLGLASHPRVTAAARDGLERHGAGNCESRLHGGDLALYRALEGRLAALQRTGDAVLFASGYMANLGVLSSIVKAATLARLHGYRARKRHKYAYYSDECNHVSIREGIQLSGALRYNYRHGDMDHLESLLTAGAEEGATPVIVSDGVFGMEGTIAPLPALVALAERHGALLYIDDAHATGVLGAHGGGTAEHFGCHSPCLMQMGSLGKALGASGGFVAVERDMADVIRLTSAAYGYSRPPPPSQAAALLAALDVLEEEPQRRKRLWDNQRYFIERMAPLGYTFVSTQTPILPVLVGEAEACQRHAIALRKEGIQVESVQFPAAPVGQARLRFVMNAGHTGAQIDHVVRVMAQLAGRASRLA